MLVANKFRMPGTAANIEAIAQVARSKDMNGRLTPPGLFLRYNIPADVRADT